MKVHPHTWSPCISVPSHVTYETQLSFPLDYLEEGGGIELEFPAFKDVASREVRTRVSFMQQVPAGAVQRHIRVPTGGPNNIYKYILTVGAGRRNINTMCRPLN